ncbi:hypothetical protein KST23_06680 [Fusobacterium nucleatum]|uniref:hypothetical protein n=1 Tax=Fusobacterium nucleatum TaxID=851 RepID=UPI003CFECEEF
MKKILLLILTIFLFACSNTENEKNKIEVSNIARSGKTENIKHIISTSPDKIYILTENYDFEFIGNQAEIVKDLIEIENIMGVNDKNPRDREYQMYVNLKGEITFKLDYLFILTKKSETNNNPSKEYLDKLEEKAKKFRNKLNEKNIKYEFLDNSEKYDFYIKEAPEAKGKIVKLENRNKILEKSSLNEKEPRIEMTIEYVISKKEYDEKVKELEKEEFKNKISTIILSPFLAAGIIILSPFMLIGSLINGS